jgi:hypothetical protein
MNNGTNVTKSNDQRAPMDCAEFRELLHELDRPGTAGAAKFDSAMLHAEACGDCGVLLVEEESLGFALQSVARETARMPHAARIEASLLEEFRNQNSSAVLPATAAVMPARRKINWQIVAMGIAAVLLFVLGSVIYQRNLPRAPSAPAPAVAANPAKTDTSSPSLAENSATTITPTTAANTAATAKVTAPTNHAASSTEAEPVEYATAYVPLPYADDPSALEGGAVVRVTLARSALEAYGLPVDGLEAGDRVTADMIVSEDGTPQAIRLVSVAD